MIDIGSRVQVVAPEDRPSAGRAGTVIRRMFGTDTWLVKLDRRFRTRRTYVYLTKELSVENQND